jgi:hypothetical protein
MSKNKMRCITCGKWFQSANVKDVTCPECVQKARKDKLASKAAPPAAQKPGQAAPGAVSPARPNIAAPKQKPVSSSTSHWFDSINDVKVSEPDPPQQRPKLSPSPASRDAQGGASNRGSAGQREEAAQGGSRGPGSGGNYRGPGAYRNAPLSGSIVGGISQRPRQPMEGGAPARSGGEHRIDKYHVGGKKGEKPTTSKRPKTAPPPKQPKREKIPPPEPFKPTPEQVAQVEARYLELVTAQGEFDGIRSQIAQETSVPKKTVKQIVKNLREREHIPSWWETQIYKGDSEEKEKIQAAYQPYLPVPPVGIHRQIADELDLKPGLVYQAIKTIRQEMNLPQYNDPSFHAAEFDEIKRKAREAREAKEAAKAARAAQAAAEKAATATLVEEKPVSAETQEAEKPAETSESQPAAEMSESQTAAE